MKKIWVIIIGIVAFMLVLGIGAAAGGAAVYFLLRDDVTPVFASPLKSSSEDGVIISSVVEGSPAENAGIVRGDILMKIGSQEVNSFTQLVSSLETYQPGETVSLSVLHGDDLRTLSTELGEKDGSPYLGISTCVGVALGEGVADGGPVGLGREIEIIKKSGIVIAEIVEDSPASDAGLAAGDIILTIDGDEIDAETSLADLVDANEPGDVLKLGIFRDGEEIEIDVTLGENPDEEGQAYLGVHYLPADSLIWLDGELKRPFFDLEAPGVPFLRWNFPGFLHGEDLPEGVENAILITDVIADTPAEEAGLKHHDLIIFLDGDPLSGREAFIENIQARSPGERITLTVLRDNEEIEIDVTLGEHPDDPEGGYLGVKVDGFIKIIRQGKDHDGLKFDLKKEFILPCKDA